VGQDGILRTDCQSGQLVGLPTRRRLATGRDLEAAELPGSRLLRSRCIVAGKTFAINSTKQSAHRANRSRDLIDWSAAKSKQETMACGAFPVKG